MVAFHLPGGIPVYIFSLLIALGVFVGLIWIAWQAPQEEMLLRVDAGLWSMLGALVGGRALYVVVHWSYFQNHLKEGIQVFSGGLTWPGALAGGLVSLAVYAGWRRLPFGELADALVPLLAVLSVSVWLGCWLDGCAYGSLTSSWWGLPARDESGVISSRLPLQLLGATMTLALFWLLDQLASRWDFRSGMFASLSLLSFSVLLLGLSFLRVDPALYWNGSRLEVWSCLLFMGVSLIALLIFWVIGRRAQDFST